MGMTGSAEMPRFLLDCVAEHAANQTIFDMVYKPLETPFLKAATANGGRPVDGLVMLIGQARPAFESFFGRPAPGHERRLRDLLVT
jgi:shikimate dehydrogenase